MDWLILALLLIIIIAIVLVHIYQRRSRAIIRKLHVMSINNHWAALSLQSVVFGTNIAFPASKGWSLGGDLLTYLQFLIASEKPEVVVELGSGLSTVLLARALEKVDGRLISVEADAEYMKITEALLKGANLLERVTLIHAPLEEAKEAGHIWFRQESLVAINKVDLLIVDGPPQRTCKLARYPALPFFHQKLSTNAMIVLDDAARDDEKETIRRWKIEFPEMDVEPLPFSHGPALIRMCTRRHQAKDER